MKKLLCSLMILITAMAGFTFATQIKVDRLAAGANNGSSWADAYNHLQDALKAAENGDEIWVAQGTYKPDLGVGITPGDRTATFQLKNGIAIYGGFPSGGGQWQDRYPNTYETILRGDLSDNDGVNFVNNEENSFHVVTGNDINTTALIDGFTIIGGNANSNTDPDHRGGGMYLDSAAPTIANCIFSLNYAVTGAGICNRNSSPEIIKCIFNNNSGGDGGGIHNVGDCKPILANCIFNKNSASYKGGALRFAGGCHPIINNCTFSGNSAITKGGGIYTYGTGSYQYITSCIFWGNIDSGGSDESAQIHIDDGTAVINFSCLQGWTGSLGGDGNIGTNPQFTDASNNDFRLKSQAGRWEPNSNQWVKDNITSPCIDGGDPNSNWPAEFWPHGMRINMGAFGGTKQASMSLSDAGNIADLNTDGSVNYQDLKILSENWLHLKSLLTEDLSRNGSVNCTDFSIFANQWFWQGQGWHPIFPWNGTELSLWDVYGRKFYLSDYAGMPTLLYTGPCWCGGCQTESNYIDDFANEYAPRGLHIIRGVCGDNELSALDFQKHYKLPIVHLMDTNRVFDKVHNTNGWPFFAIFDKTGTLVYKKIEGYVHRELETIEPIIDSLLEDSPQITPVIRDGAPYPPITITRSGENITTLKRERFSSIACSSDGKIYVVFTSNRNGNSDVFIKVYNGTSWSVDTAIATTSADEYDGQVIVDNQDKVWVSWTSNSNSDHFNIFTKTFSNATLSTPVMSSQVTQSYDGAMHSRMACDIMGRVWITYYKWGINQGSSRDKEVYLRRWDNTQWSNEIHLSPTDVPEYEDHSDPTISAFASGVAVFWSWDFHEPAGYLDNYTKPGPYPTIFGRSIDAAMNLGPVTDISGDSGGKDIDLTPVTGVDTNNHIWCVWDSKDNGNSYLKTVRVKNIATDTIYNVTEPVVNVCTPCVVISPIGTVTIVWSQTSDGNSWVLKRSVYNSSTNSFSSPETLHSENDPRFCSAIYDNTGQLWISCSVKTAIGREIIVINP